VTRNTKSNQGLAFISEIKLDGNCMSETKHKTLDTQCIFYKPKHYSSRATEALHIQIYIHYMVNTPFMNTFFRITGCHNFMRNYFKNRGQMLHFHSSAFL